MTTTTEEQPTAEDLRWIRLIEGRASRLERAEAALEPCGICGEALLDHEDAERYCPRSPRDRAVEGDTRYCAASTWEVTLEAEKLRRAWEEAERGLMRVVLRADTDPTNLPSGMLASDFRGIAVQTLAAARRQLRGA